MFYYGIFSGFYNPENPKKTDTLFYQDIGSFSSAYFTTKLTTRPGT